jgi:hypothetical protein
MSKELTGWALEQAHQQQRALGYVSLLEQALHTPDADYRRILSDFEALAGAIARIKRAGEELEAETKPRRIEAPRKITTAVRQINPAAWGGEVSAPLKVVAEDVVIPIRRL